MEIKFREYLVKIKGLGISGLDFWVDERLFMLCLSGLHALREVSPFSLRGSVQSLSWALTSVASARKIYYFFVYQVGMRCEVSPLSLRGSVAFVSSNLSGLGPWVGVILDEPVEPLPGQWSDGRFMDGRAYFEVPGDGYGMWAKPANVRVGDQFQPLDPFEGLSD